MKVRMRVDVSGTRDGKEWPRRGSVIDLPDGEAADYCRTGMADPVPTFDDAERAIMPPAEVREPEPAPELRTDTDSGQAIRRGPGRPRKVHDQYTEGSTT